VLEVREGETEPVRRQVTQRCSLSVDDESLRSVCPLSEDGVTRRE
jgi:hypothetical protein